MKKSLSESVKAIACNAEDDSFDGSVPLLLVALPSGDCTPEMLIELGPPEGMI